MDSRAFAIELFDKWTAMWNGELLLADQIMASDFILRYAQPETEAMDLVRTSAAISQLIAAWRVKRGGPIFRAEGDPIVEVSGQSSMPTGVIARPYGVTLSPDGRPPHTVSGIDILRFRQGRIIDVLSASGGAAGRSFGLT